MLHTSPANLIDDAAITLTSERRRALSLGALLVVVLKTALDVWLHLRERRRQASTQTVSD